MASHIGGDKGPVDWGQGKGPGKKVGQNEAKEKIDAAFAAAVSLKKAGPAPAVPAARPTGPVPKSPDIGHLAEAIWLKLL